MLVFNSDETKLEAGEYVQSYPEYFWGDGYACRLN